MIVIVDSPLFVGYGYASMHPVIGWAIGSAQQRDQLSCSNVPVSEMNPCVGIQIVVEVGLNLVDKIVL